MGEATWEKDNKGGMTGSVITGEIKTCRWRSSGKWLDAEPGTKRTVEGGRGI